MTSSHSSRLIGGHGRQEGDGALSREELYIDKHAEKNVYETPNATSIGTAEERTDREERLQEVNEERDRHSDGFAERMHYADRGRIIEALCSSLPVSKMEMELAVSAFEDLALDQFGNQKAVEKVAFATIRHVVDKRRREHGAGWKNLLRTSDEYQASKDRVLPNERGFMKLCNKVSDAIEHDPIVPQFSTTIPGRDPNLPDTYPRKTPSGENWDQLSAMAWEYIARNWDSHPEQARKQVPDEFRDLIERLRRWEPWTEKDRENKPRSPDGSEQENTPQESISEEKLEELLDELAEEVEKDSN